MRKTRRWAAWVLMAMGLVVVGIAPGQAWAQSQVTPAAETPDAADAPDASAAASSFDPAAVNLRPMFEEGRTSRYSFWTQRVQQSQTRMGPHQSENTVVMVVEGEVTWRVLSVRGDGGATCQLMYDQVVVTLTTPDGRTMVADSRQSSSENPDMHEFVRAVVGVPVQLEMAADGSAVSVSGTQAIQQRISDPQRAPKDEDFLQTASTLATLPLAPATLAVGGQWPGDFNWRHTIGRLRMVTQSRLVDVQEMAGIPVATVLTSAQLHITPELPPGVDASQIQIRVPQSSYRSQVLFDLQRHETVGSHANRQIVLQVRLQGPDGQSVEQQTTETLQEQILRIAEQDDL